MVLHGSVFSKTLGMQTGLTIFTPEELIDKNETYSVVYLLHGLYGNSQVWLNNTMLTQYAGRFKSIVVMPEGGRSFYANMKHGYNYFTYIAEELPDIVSNIFKISEKQEDTAIIGCSMGGYGALKIALSKPKQYGFCGAISPACLYLHEYLTQIETEGKEWASHSEINAAILRDFYSIFGDDLEKKEEDSILHLAENCSKLKNNPKVHVLCGTDDELITENRRFYKTVQKLKGLNFTLDEGPGKHDWFFFNKGLKRMLEVWADNKAKK